MDNTEQINWGDFINYRGTTVIPNWVNKIDDQAFCLGHSQSGCMRCEKYVIPSSIAFKGRHVHKCTNTCGMILVLRCEYRYRFYHSSIQSIWGELRYRSFESDAAELPNETTDLIDRCRNPA